MEESAILKLAVIVIAGVAAQWLAWITRLPSILFLLTVGIVLGPVTNFLNPDHLFGELLLPAASLAVALILYEGGLTLRVSELPRVGRVVGSLVILGAIITWVVSAIAARLIFDLQWSLAALLGAILVVTGPTVIGPLLQLIRPTGPSGAILKWEGIVIDPVGALLAVLVFESILIRDMQHATMQAGYGIIITIVAGGGLGIVAAAILAAMIRFHLAPEFLQNALSLMLVVAVFVLSNLIQEESGLFAATVMGLVLANQKKADIEDIVEFKENLRVLLISALFITLAARLHLDDLIRLLAPCALFIAVLVFVARPLAVAASTTGSKLKWRERAFIAAVAPRGIVAAAVASVFALRLEHQGFEGAALLVPVTFSVIIGTVVFYGVLSPVFAKQLGVADADPQGILFVGAPRWARELAGVLVQKGVTVAMVDSNRRNCADARMAGITAYAGSALAESAIEKWDLAGIGRLFAVTPNDWVNILTVERFRGVFGRQHCYQLVPPTDADAKKTDAHQHLRGRSLFGETVDSAYLNRQIARGSVIKATTLSEEFDKERFQRMYGESAVILCIIDPEKRVRVATADTPLKPAPGDTIISLVQPIDSP